MTDGKGLMAIVCSGLAYLLYIIVFVAMFLGILNIF